MSVENNESKIPNNLGPFNEGFRFMVEGVGFGVVTGLEMIRGSLVNPLIHPLNFVESIQTKEIPESSLPEDSPLFTILQNSGDFYDGYMFGWLAYNALSGVDLLQGRFTKKYFPQRLKQSMGLLVSCGVVTAAETGLLDGGTADLSDIPAGILGGIAYLGINHLVRKLVFLGEKRRQAYEAATDEKFL